MFIIGCSGPHHSEEKTRAGWQRTGHLTCALSHERVHRGCHRRAMPVGRSETSKSVNLASHSGCAVAYSQLPSSFHTRFFALQGKIRFSSPSVSGQVIHVLHRRLAFRFVVPVTIMHRSAFCLKDYSNQDLCRPCEEKSRSKSYSQTDRKSVV